ncbi:MAG: tripartite tricarboxylate transporter substrate binding protein [Firmicutes bacterium]|nr:tripartite tricarboxylate transporter substrate binding protein [Bacillota bacterium]
MKKLLAMLLVLAMVFCMAACGDDAEAEFPTKPIEMIVGYAAGGGTDTLARTAAQYVELDGQTMTTSNMEGANGLIGSMECYNADPDGYTLQCAFPETWGCLYLTETTDVELYKEMTPICSMVYDVNALVVSKDSPFETLEDLVKYAKEHPGEISLASVATGNVNHLSSLGFADITGIDITYVPYESASKARVALLGGHEDLWVCQCSELKSVYDSGDVRVLAVASEERVSFLPDVPTFKECGYDIVAGLHRAFYAPPETPDEVVAYLESAFKAVYDQEEVKSLLRDQLGFDPVWTDGAELEQIALSAADTFSKWADLMGK